MLSLLLLQCSDSNDQDQDTGDLPIQTEFTVDDFNSAEECRSCHPQYYDEWASSMHFYAMQDPVWINSQMGRQAYYSDKGIEVGYLCLQCHSPVALLTEGIEDLGNLDAAAIAGLPAVIREGVTCDVCHTITHLPASTEIFPEAGQYVGAEYKLNLDGTQYGRLEDPVANNFHESAYHDDYGKSEICRNCHDIFIGGIGAEITYTEWSGSAFDAMGMECQTCHMPVYTGRAAVGGPIRDNLHRHYFPGVDEALIDGYPGKPEQKAAIEALLVNSAEIHRISDNADTLTAGSTAAFEFLVSNLTGHNFPSSVPFVRQLWLEVAGIFNGDTVFVSGHLDENGDLYDFHIDPTGQIDPQLALFNTVLYNAAGDSGLNNLSVEELVSLSDYTLPVNGSRRANYSIDLPAGEAGEFVLTARLLLRSFPPFVLRANDLNPDDMSTFLIDQSESHFTLVTP